MHDETTVRARRNGSPAGELNRHRHYKAIVVVGVLANQIDASRRSEDARLPAEEAAKRILQVAHRWRPRIVPRRPSITMTSPNARSTSPQSRLTLIPSD